MAAEAPQRYPFSTAAGGRCGHSVGGSTVGPAISRRCRRRRRLRRGRRSCIQARPLPSPPKAVGGWERNAVTVGAMGSRKDVRRGEERGALVVGMGGEGRTQRFRWRAGGGDRVQRKAFEGGRLCSRGTRQRGELAAGLPLPTSWASPPAIDRGHLIGASRDMQFPPTAARHPPHRLHEWAAAGGLPGRGSHRGPKGVARGGGAGGGRRGRVGLPQLRSSFLGRRVTRGPPHHPLFAAPRRTTRHGEGVQLSEGGGVVTE